MCPAAQRALRRVYTHALAESKQQNTQKLQMKLGQRMCPEQRGIIYKDALFSTQVQYTPSESPPCTTYVLLVPACTGLRGTRGAKKAASKQLKNKMDTSLAQCGIVPAEYLVNDPAVAKDKLAAQRSTVKSQMGSL